MSAKILTDLRFLLPRNASEFFERNPSLRPEGDYTIPPPPFAMPYTENTDFGRQYLRADLSHIETIAKFFPMGDFLANISWNTIAQAVIPQLIGIIDSLREESETGGVLGIIEASPLAMVVMGEALRSAGMMHIAYQFRRESAVNSDTKVLEALLFLIGRGVWRDTCLSTVCQALGSRLDTLIARKDSIFLLFEENITAPEYDYHRIDPYLKTQIGYKPGRVVYRLDTYPDTAFLASKDIAKVRVYDTDTVGKTLDSYEEMLRKASSPIDYRVCAYPRESIQGIGLYEDELVRCNTEYLASRARRESEVRDRYSIGSDAETKTNPTRVHRTSTHRKDIQKIKDIQMMGTPLHIIVPIVIIPLLVLSLLLRPLLHSSTTGTTTSTSGGGYGSNGYYGASWIPMPIPIIGSWGGGGGSSIGSSSRSSSSVSSNKNTFSSIRSFGGGGFSKGWS